MAYDAKKIYYRFDDYLSRLVLDYEASRQIDEDSERLYHGFPNAPYSITSSAACAMPTAPASSRALRASPTSTATTGSTVASSPTRAA